MRHLGKTGFIHQASRIVLILSGLCISLFLAWITLSASNFFYPVLHDVIGIQDTIEEYAPKNIYKKSFEKTTRTQRTELFRGIVHGINHDGEGLATIRYADANGKPLGLLLRAPEIIHLKDVARLLDVLRTSAYLAFAVFVVTLVLLRIQQTSIPKPRYLFAGTVLTILAVVLVIVLFGVKDAFYELHTLVFPQGHQWFFYYEESLMTLLMKAPDIFAWIAALLLTLALVIFYLLLVFSHILLEPRDKGLTAS